MAKKNQTNRQKAKTLAAKGVSAKKIQQRTGVSKQAAQKFTQKAAAPTPPPTQATPASFQVTPQTQTTGFSFTPAEKASGNIFGTDIGNGLTAYTQGAPIKDPSVLRQQIGLSATPEAAPAAAASTAATGGGGGGGQGKQKQKKDISDKGLKAQLKIYGADNKIGGKEYKKLIAQGFTPEQIVKRLDIVNENKGLKIGLGSNVLNKIGKEIAADPFSAISIPGAGNVAARGFGEGKLGEAIKQLAGGTEAPGQRTSPAPAPNQLLKPEPGTIGAGGIQPGQVLRASGQVGTRQPTRAERVLANQGTIAAAPNVAQPAAPAQPAQPAAPAAPAVAAPVAPAVDDFGIGDLGGDMGTSPYDDSFIDTVSDTYGDIFQDVFKDFNPVDPVTAEILRKYGVGRNYNIDAIRAALRNRLGRRSYLRDSLQGGNPFRSALAFGPTLGGLMPNMGGVAV
jgi:hypothetical protein